MTTAASETPVAEPRGPRPASDLKSGIVPRALVLLVGMAAVVIVLAGVRATAWLLGPVFMALVVVIAVAPVYGALLRRRWPGWAATLVVLLLVYAIMISLALGVVFAMARLATELPQYASAADDMLAGASARLAELGIGPEQLRQAAASLDLGKLAGLLGELLNSVAGLASNFVFLLALLLFLSIETGGAADRFASIAADRPKATDAVQRFAAGTRSYLVVTAVFGLIVAVLDGVALWIVGIPLAFTWGVLSFITNFIPNIGFVIGLIPPAVLGLLIGGPQKLAVVVLIYGVLNFVVQSLIQPRFVGDAVGLSVTVTFLALALWAWLLGPLGAILAIPLTLLGKTLLVDIDPLAGWADALLRSTPKEPSPGAAEWRAAAPT
jgi:AI-2 transport protein TqsA